MVYRELQEIVREVFERRDVPLQRAGAIRLALEAEIEGLRDAAPGQSDSGGRDRFVELLVARANELARQLTLDSVPFPPGQLHCFWCGGFECAHTTPPEPRAVFRGYSSTGEPLWTEFASLALESQHPGIDSLYRGGGAPLTLVQPGSKLTQAQLSVYGKNSGVYRILGQVLLGYIPFKAPVKAPNGNGASAADRPRLALTIQAVETRHATRRHHLNVLGALPDGQPVSQFLEESLDWRLVDALGNARAKLGELWLSGSGANGGDGNGGARPRRDDRAAPRAVERKAMRILTRLARNLDRIYRQRSRRTQHAQERHRDRERPASTALRDALRANGESIYRDVQAGTWIVIGPRSRVHVFNDSGHHVTSVVYPGETIRKRTTQGKWRRPADDVRQAFMSTLRATRPAE